MSRLWDCIPVGDCTICRHLLQVVAASGGFGETARAVADFTRHLQAGHGWDTAQTRELLGFHAEDP